MHRSLKKILCIDEIWDVINIFHTFLVKTQIKEATGIFGRDLNADEQLKNYNSHLFFNTCAKALVFEKRGVG